MSEISNNKCGTKLLKINVINDEKDENELRDEIRKLNDKLHEKLTENEKYQQEIHEIRRTLKASLATQKDLTEANELMEIKFLNQENTAKKEINNILEKFAIEKKQYEERIFELQTSFDREEKKNEELREALNCMEKSFAMRKFEDLNKIQENLNLKEQIKNLVQDLELKQQVEKELLTKQQQLDEIISNLQKNYNEVNEILQVKKVDLRSLNETLETTREELFLCRSELESLKASPASDSIKGNSLFAEVEDNRQKLINDIKLLKKKYLQIKQTDVAKENEIRLLKIEKAELLRRWDEDTLETVDHSARLIETYKSRISELESKLKMEEKNRKMKEANKEEPAENNFSYLQSLLTAKKKEVEELYNKLEESSTEKILQEEIKYEVEKQLRQWKCKAMSYQAQLSATQNQMKCEECMKMKLKDTGNGDLAARTNNFEVRTTIIPVADSEEINNSDTTLQKPLQDSQQESETISNLNKSEDDILAVKGEETVYMDETIPVYSRSSSDRKSISDHEFNRENEESNSKDGTIVLKSALAKSEDNFSEKSKKNLRFATDTVDHEKPKPVRQKIEKKTYPVVYISNQSSR